jgi:hypothetical protein
MPNFLRERRKTVVRLPRTRLLRARVNGCKEEGRVREIRRATGKGEGAARKMDPPHRGTIAGVDESSVNFPGKLEAFPIP